MEAKTTTNTRSKKILFTGIETYLLTEALKAYSANISTMQFPKNTIVTKEYYLGTIAEINHKLT